MTAPTVIGGYECDECEERFARWERFTDHLDERGACPEAEES